MSLLEKWKHRKKSEKKIVSKCLVEYLIISDKVRDSFFFPIVTAR